jgi:type II secretory pathway pseudopilin PulG
MLELSVCLTVMGALLAVAAHSFARAQQHVNVMEAVFMMEGPKIAMMEYRAVTGYWPATNEQAAYKPLTGNRLSSVMIRPGGAVDITFSNRIPELSGKVLTIRAWQASPASALATAWPCGHAGAMPLIAASVDKTTFSDDELPSPCRAHH